MDKQTPSPQQTSCKNKPEPLSPAQFESIAKGLYQAGESLTCQGARSPGTALRLAADNFRMLAIQRKSFAHAADELDAAAAGIENHNASLGFAVAIGLLRFPSPELLEEASEKLNLPELAKPLREINTLVIGIQALLRELEKNLHYQELLKPALDDTLLSWLPDSLEMRPDIAGSSVVVLGSMLKRIGSLLATSAPLLSLFQSLRICPENECETAGVIDCELIAIRIHTPVRQFSTYKPAGEFRLGEGAAADVIDALAERLLEFIETGQFTDDEKNAIRDILSGAGLAAIIKRFLTGQIGIEAVVAWLMEAIGPIVSGAAATALAAAIAISLAMATFAVALAKIYAEAITQPVNRGVLICAKFTYRVCVEGICYNSIVNKEIDLKINPRAAGIFDVNTDIWTGSAGELGQLTPEELITYQYLLDLIARLVTQINTSTDPIERVKLQAEKQEAERQLATLTRARDFLRDLRQRIGSTVCDALKDGDDLQTLERHNLTPC